MWPHPGPPRLGLSERGRYSRRARAAARRRPALPVPVPSDWPGLSPGRGAQSPLAAAAARNELVLGERLVNNRGRRGRAPGPRAPQPEASGTRDGVRLLAIPSAFTERLWGIPCVLSSAHSPYPPTPQEEAVWGDLSLREVKRLPEAMAEYRLESKFLRFQSAGLLLLRQ